jgi:predicted DNA-binding transcriptional regulator AlpA
MTFPCAFLAKPVWHQPATPACTDIHESHANFSAFNKIRGQQGFVSTPQIPQTSARIFSLPGDFHDIEKNRRVSVRHAPAPPFPASHQSCGSIWCDRPPAPVRRRHSIHRPGRANVMSRRHQEPQLRQSCARLYTSRTGTPYPPRGFSRAEAATYIGVGTTKFDEMVADGRMPRPKRIDGRVVWDRVELDAYFTSLPDDDPPNPLDRM